MDTKMDSEVCLILCSHRWGGRW